MFFDKPERRRTYLWQRPDWPQWRFDAAALAAPLAQVHRAQGHLAGRMAGLGLAERDQATLQTLTQEVITTRAIEGEALNLDAVRSCVARRLGGGYWRSGSGRPQHRRRGRQADECQVDGDGQMLDGHSAAGYQ